MMRGREEQTACRWFSCAAGRITHLRKTPQSTLAVEPSRDLPAGYSRQVTFCGANHQRSRKVVRISV